MATTTANPQPTSTVNTGNTTVPTPSTTLDFTQSSFKIPRNESQMSQSGLTFGDSYSQTLQANGYLAGIEVNVQATGGSGAVTAAVGAADSPWNAITRISLVSPGATKPIYTLSGYNAFLAGQFGGYRIGDLTKRSYYSAVQASGNFGFSLYIPVEIISRMGLGCLANMNSAALYTLEIELAGDTTVYTTAPGTLPTIAITVRSWNYTKPAPQNTQGVKQSDVPPLFGTVQYWTAQKSNALSGETFYNSTRVENLIRNIILVTRDSSTNARADYLPDLTRINLNGTLISQISPNIAADNAIKWFPELTAPALPLGVYVWSMCYDYDGRAGEELRNLWLPTQNSDKLEFSGNFANSTTLELVTNDIAASGPYLTSFIG